MINTIGLFITPHSQWQRIAENNNRSIVGPLAYICVMAWIPAVAWFYGTTVVGWQVGDGETIRFSKSSATALISLFYFAMVACVSGIGYIIARMAETYGSHSTLAKGFSVAGLSATPLFLAGAVGFIPIFSLDVVVCIAAIAYSMYLFCDGIPTVMNTPEDRVFLYASAALTAVLVVTVVLLVTTVILWDMGLSPEFID